MVWIPKVVGGKQYDNLTWIDRVDQEFAAKEGCDLAEAMRLIYPHWDEIKFAIGLIDTVKVEGLA